MTKNPIQHISDTAYWVAYYRAQETARRDAIFKDLFAKELAGEIGERAAKSAGSTGRYTKWTVTLRTRVIDDLILKLVAGEVDTVINLGAGLDTRPYRLELPKNLRWVEADYPHVIDFKTKVLTKATPKCRLEHERIDLADRGKRREFLKRVARDSKSAVVLTEGLVVYLTETQVAELAADLKEQPPLSLWIAEYLGPAAIKALRNRQKVLERSPLRFFPDDWFGFFKQQGWSPREVKYLGEEGMRLRRPFPAPFLFRLIRPFLKREFVQAIQRVSAFVLFEKSH